jgi:cell division protein FtsI/penicillin-binding protein 2
MSHQINKVWIKIILAGFFILLAGFLYRLYGLQVDKHDQFIEIANNQYTNPYLKEVNRGAIILKRRDGTEFFAATNKEEYSLEINPSIIKNPEDTFNILSSIIELNEEEYFSKAKKENDTSEIIATDIPMEKAEQIKEIGLSGLLVNKNNARFYPGKSLAARVLGFQSFKGDEYRGRYGLERYYDEILNKDDDVLFQNFFVEIFSGITNAFGEGSGGSIVSTIEPNVQTFAEDIAFRTNLNWSSEKTGIIVMDPNTGAIKAMTIAPTFDVNVFNEVDDISIFNNESVEGVYEMGSIIKPLTVAIGLDTETITSETTYEDKGSLTLNTETIYNYDKKARGVVNMQEVLNQSLNTGVAYIASKVGSDEFSKYMKTLIGERSGIDLPNEVSPQVANLDSNRDIEQATASYGHGIAISPVQTIRALATLGNGGKLVTPHVVSEIKYDLGVTKKVAPTETKKVFKPETSEEISRMLTAVVDDALLGGTVSLPNYSIAAKTGTALIANSIDGGYFDDRFLHTFFGYFPSFDPQFIILLYTIEPKGALYSSQTLTEPFMDLAKYLINYYEIEPDR